MRIKSITIDLGQIFACIVALILGLLGLVSWWVILLVVLFTVHVNFSFEL